MRILTHERQTRDAPVLGSNLQIQAEHAVNVEETEEHKMSPYTKKNTEIGSKPITNFWKAVIQIILVLVLDQ